MFLKEELRQKLVAKVWLVVILKIQKSVYHVGRNALRVSFVPEDAEDAVAVLENEEYFLCKHYNPPMNILSKVQYSR